ncbi:MAG: glycerol-3-phosphate 1-O-acyltransferase PlsB [Moraxellaceae bacterium]|jgi:glycerol-3-phosphate O-acyltransferase|nr:glycerol-3-phosphate 1-O-acyltransferase PlsB [Moraxellaceae bacterium]MBP7229592.1 glycerol-3-phosphate 1-O-acyltransferase PlsB [Moraxellaceae bacterium]MBP8851896.1 glycerol-3-phosphate 1-O-acyltransferase PlsB [Moraxellaceae bacterium]MBP9045015.1 glycerol-3-phosphate 1-O-acyltransferase PlsB [Moraxellaceae bacterium]MBP9730046.1 glycerol-3-phosphate 1-O-acyltransferase PlsB [Moraxellaceae bacterium]
MTQWFSALFTAIARKLLFLFVRTNVIPEDLSLLQLDPDKPVCYVLQTRFFSNLLVLEQETRRANLPRALRPMQGNIKERRSMFFLMRSDSPSPFQRNRFAHSPRMVRLLQAVRENPQLDVQLVPVTILWGRSPDKESSIFKILFADSWATPGIFKQFITILLHGRQTLVKFNAPISVRALVDEGQSEEITARKLARVLRVHFRRQREIAIGPDLSHRRILVRSLLNTAPVKTAIAREAAEKNIPTEKAEARALAYADEIAADYSHPIIRILHIFLTWLWTRLYDGVEIHHFDDVRKTAHENEIIYVPSHRSHIDYLLLSYVIYSKGLVPPHIAAGSNLNMPVIGSILRRGGAFFLRRSFKGNFLYSAVFNEYIHLITSKGYSIEYFIEGGRSRTGRLLSPRTGMLVMTLRSYLRDHARPIVFVPTYIGYEKLMEGKTYVGELSGKPKKKESILGLVSTVRKIQKTFGKVHVSFGEPISLAQLLDEEYPLWRDTELAEDDRPEWMMRTINRLAQGINTNINSTAVVNPINLLSLVLLAMPKHAMDENALIRQIDRYRVLLQQVAYSHHIVITDLSGRDVIAYGEKLKLLQRIRHPLGDMICLGEEEAMLLTYFRNNVLHLFTLPSLIACLMLHNNSLHRDQVVQLVRNIYPFLQSELFLPWCNESVEEIIHKVLDALTEAQLLTVLGDGVIACPSPNSEEYTELNVLGQSVRQNLERYYMTVSLLTQQGSGGITQKRLVDLCQLLAQRLSILHEFSAPEFSDKSLFHTFVETLRNIGHIQTDDSDHLSFDHRLIDVAEGARLILPPDMRQAIQQITRVTDEEIEIAMAAKEQKEKRGKR